MSESLSQQIIQLLKENQKREQIEALLLHDGHEEYFVKEIVRESIKLYSAKQRSQGLMLILAGAAICLFSCIITMVGSSFSDGSFAFVLYGLTTLGIIIVFAGLMKVF